MAKNDYFVIVCRILASLYECLKEGCPANLEYLHPESKTFPVNSVYWEQIWRWILEDGYVEGVKLMPILGERIKLVKIEPDVSITPKGIEFLQSNSSMEKAKKFLKTLKAIIPGL